MNKTEFNLKEERMNKKSFEKILLSKFILFPKYELKLMGLIN